MSRAGTGLLVRREPLHPGAPQTYDIDGFRLTAVFTDQPDIDIAILDARHRAQARIEDRIRCAKNTGLAAMPLDTFDRNQRWCQLVAIACDLLTVAQRLARRGTHRTAEPKVLRDQLLHVAGRIVHTARRKILRSRPTGPGVNVLTAAFRRLRARPTPARLPPPSATTGTTNRPDPTPTTPTPVSGSRPQPDETSGPVLRHRPPARGLGRRQPGKSRASRASHSHLPPGRRRSQPASLT